MGPDRRFCAVRPIAVAIVGVVLATSCSSDDDAAELRSTTSTTSAPTTTTTTTAAPIVAVDGARSLDDPLTPGSGNGGYLVDHYDLQFDVTQVTADGPLQAVATIELTTTEPLATFSLDFVGYTTASVTVDDAPATFEQVEEELIIRPSETLSGTHSVEVTYSGVPAPVADDSAPGTIGWQRSEYGTYVVAEPNGMRSVFPSNDHPSDPARFSITLISNATETAAASGRSVTRSDLPDGRVSETFELTRPNPTYALQVAVGNYELITSDLVLGGDTVTVRHVVAPTITAQGRAALDLTLDQLEWFHERFGYVPENTYGILAADAPLVFALETSTLSMIPAAWMNGGPADPSVQEVTAHELAHQYFGNQVSPATWSDLWLNEGWATYLSWLWLDDTGVVPLAENVSYAESTLRSLRREFGAVTEPTQQTLWSDNQYTGAAIVVHALRLEVGDEVFNSIMTRWPAQGDDGVPRSTADFQAFSAELAGRDLTSFFDAWLRSTEAPALPGS